MTTLLIPSILAASITVPALASDCPFFGADDREHNIECLVEEYQGYAEAWAGEGVVPVVLTENEYRIGKQVFGRGVLFIDGQCIVLLPAPFAFDDLWDAEDKCSKGFK